MAHFDKAGVAPQRYLVELRTDDAGSYQVGQTLGPDIFEVGQKSTSRNDARQGLCGRHEAPWFPWPARHHGVQRKTSLTRFHRRLFNPGRVFKGMRMAGRTGHVRQTTQNLTIQAIDAERDSSSCVVPFRPAWRRRADPQRSEGAWLPLTFIPGRWNPEGHGRAAESIFDVQTNVPLIHPGCDRAAGRGPPGHRRHQDPRRGARRWQVNPTKQKGTSRARQGLDPAPPVRRRRGCAWADAA